MSKEIDLTNINWNKLSPEEFVDISNSLNDVISVKNKKLKLEKKLFVIQINGKKYQISFTDYSRYKSLKTEKSKENFKQKIEKNNKPLLEI